MGRTVLENTDLPKELQEGKRRTVIANEKEICKKQSEHNAQFTKMSNKIRRNKKNEGDAPSFFI